MVALFVMMLQISLCHFGISIDDEFVIPFTMMGTIIFFESRVPTKWEMENCRVFIMSHDSTWDPTTVQISSVTPCHHLHTIATLKSNQESPKQTQVNHELVSMSEAYDEYTFLSHMVKTVTVHDSRTSTADFGIMVSYMLQKSFQLQLDQRRVVPAWKKLKVT
jgi:hypothetical protein